MTDDEDKRTSRSAFHILLNDNYCDVNNGSLKLSQAASFPAFCVVNIAAYKLWKYCYCTITVFPKLVSRDRVRTVVLVMPL